MYDISIKTVPSMTAITVEHIGPYMEIGRAFDTLFGVLATRKLITPDLRMVAIFYDDSTTVPAAKLRSRAGVLTDGNISVDAPLTMTAIAGGEYAVLRHKGHYADMKAAYNWLYGTWLPQSGRAPGSAPTFEEYLNSPRDTAPTDLLTNICLPLA